MLAACGLNLSDAIRLFLHQVVAQEGLPFAVKTPNATTVAAMKETRSIKRAKFGSAHEFFDDLEKPAQQKRANPPRNADKTKQFQKDWKDLHPRRIIPWC